jgi:hypothetical protein
MGRIDHHDVTLPAGRHLNMDRVLVPLVPKRGSKLTADGRCRVNNLPEATRFDRKYQNGEFWHDFLVWEHNMRRASSFRDMFQPGEVHAIRDYAAEEDEQDHSVIIKQEAEEPRRALATCP